MKTILVDAVFTFVRPDQGVDQDLYALLETYPNPKIILTNANDEQMKPFGLIDLPYPLFTLKHNPDKVDPVYFQTMLKQYALQPAEVVYIEHAKEAVASAESVGIQSFRYDENLKDIAAVKKFLDTNLLKPL